MTIDKRSRDLSSNFRASVMVRSSHETSLILTTASPSRIKRIISEQEIQSNVVISVKKPQAPAGARYHGTGAGAWDIPTFLLSSCFTYRSFLCEKMSRNRANSLRVPNEKWIRNYTTANRAKTIRFLTHVNKSAAGPPCKTSETTMEGSPLLK
uniref:Uncharacterized protein n=1 Tax=Romanomermis culicivorax TaxID=13658 RepID=A0A915KGM9_ROMCU